MKIKTFVVFSCLSFLTACGGGKTKDNNDEQASSNTENTSTGCSLFESAPKKSGTLTNIQGLAYTSELTDAATGIKKTIEGVTGEGGSYDFYEACDSSSITYFCLGVKKNCDTGEVASGILTPVNNGLIGSIESTETPISIKQVIQNTYPEATESEVLEVTTNVVQLLLTLDDDANSENGITLNESAREESELVVSGINFADQNFDTNQNVLQLIASAGNSETLTSEETATQFIEASPDENKTIAGFWKSNQGDANDFLGFAFFDDGTYAHFEVDELPPFDVPGEVSGMELGTYERSPESGKMTITEIIFDENAETGLTDLVGQEILFAQVSGDTLATEVDDNGNGSIEAEESYAFVRSEASAGIAGVWTTANTDSDFLMFAFLQDGRYIHAEYGSDIPVNERGMEYGTYSIDPETNQLITTQLFNSNGGRGLSEAVPFFASVTGNSLTIFADDNGNNIQDEGESLILTRQ